MVGVDLRVGQVRGRDVVLVAGRVVVRGRVVAVGEEGAVVGV